MAANGERAARGRPEKSGTLPDLKTLGVDEDESPRFQQIVAVPGASARRSEWRPRTTSSPLFAGADAGAGRLPSPRLARSSTAAALSRLTATAPRREHA